MKQGREKEVKRDKEKTGQDEENLNDRVNKVKSHILPQRTLFMSHKKQGLVIALHDSAGRISLVMQHACMTRSTSFEGSVRSIPARGVLAMIGVTRAMRGSLFESEECRQVKGFVG